MSDEMLAVARAGTPTVTRLTMDDDYEDVDVATTTKRGLALVTALGNDRIIGGLAPAGKFLSASKTAAGMARLRSRAGAMDLGPTTATGGSVPSEEYLPALFGLAAEKNFQGDTGQGQKRGW
jgi:hypothetical protein